MPKLKTPKIDAIAVTKGPGLEPALWVGINFAKALALVWDLPLYPVNHLEGHILASLATPRSDLGLTRGTTSKKKEEGKIKFPIISLIVSGGHTELVLSKDWLKYKIVGRSKLAKQAPRSDLELTRGTTSATIKLPRPMLHSGDFDFSFSGLKTAVLYLVQNLKKESKFDEKIKAEIADEFQNASIEVLIAKTLAASKKFKAQTIIAGGGVIANTALREALTKMAGENNFKLLIPELAYSTDNATMIALAAGLRLLAGKSKKSHTFKAEGNLNLK
ncbi:MAG: tRNA (adenosine(37)-N6)-threonylcarbamoyltransferase complex transferase subunit TsaD [Candidatus Vogelbacteria bacterium]|nr:tRNA (adenosine(37)-N6)-threonylcarbamoyltransferase complex transferase subunit TsaD [Candidatus Vogelbacteria bacterium]